MTLVRCHNTSLPLPPAPPFSLAARNSIRHIVKIDRRQSAGSRRSRQQEVNRRELAERQRKCKKRMIRACRKYQVYADHRARHRSTDRLHRTTRRDIAGPHWSPGGHHGGASDVEGGEVEVFDTVPVEASVSNNGHSRGCDGWLTRR